MFVKRMVVKILTIFKKCRTIATFSGEDGDDVKYNVVDHIYPVFHRLDRRCITFDNNGSYIYSSVYKSEKRHFQPIYPTMQKMIDSYFVTPPRKALVLGCAGCSIPRFLTLHYNECDVTGVEYSGQLIKIAKEHFFTKAMKERVTLIHDDAFEYMKNNAGKEKYDLIFVDIFVANKLHPQVSDEGFIQDMYDSLSDDGTVMLNAFGLPGEKAHEYIQALRPHFKASYVIRYNARYYIQMIKNKGEMALYDYENKVSEYASVYKRIVE